jgi:hypothetical protein
MPFSGNNEAGSATALPFALMNAKLLAKSCSYHRTPKNCRYDLIIEKGCPVKS